MINYYHDLETKTVLGEDVALSIWLLVGWFVLMYFCYAITCLIINCKWVQKEDFVSYEDATLELNYIHVNIFFFINKAFFEE
jgi:hypothetical protein